MNTCLHCTEATSNPKFCSKSCSAKHVNVGRRRHGLEPKICPCGKKSSNQRTHCSSKCQVLYTWLERVASIESEGDAKTEFSAKKYWLWKTGATCAICSLTEWMNQPIPLVLDHINGKADNNTLLNTRLICCNCDAQTPTYKGKNKGNGTRVKRRVK